MTLPGLFAAGGVDVMTTALLGALPPPPKKARVLDFCCGSGVISAALLAAEPSIRLYGLDADALAIRAAARNLPQARGLYLSDGWNELSRRRETRRAERRRGNSLDDAASAAAAATTTTTSSSSSPASASSAAASCSPQQPPKCFDWIVSNPPVHLGIQSDFSVLRTLIRGAAARWLAEGGSLWIVAQTYIPVGRMLAEEEAHGRLEGARAAYDDGRFVAWTATKPLKPAEAPAQAERGEAERREAEREAVEGKEAEAEDKEAEEKEEEEEEEEGTGTGGTGTGGEGIDTDRAPADEPPVAYDRAWTSSEWREWESAAALEKRRAAFALYEAAEAKNTELMRRWETEPAALSEEEACRVQVLVARTSRKRAEREARRRLREWHTKPGRASQGKAAGTACSKPSDGSASSAQAAVERRPSERNAQPATRALSAAQSAGRKRPRADGHANATYPYRNASMGAKLPPSEVSSKLQPAARAGAVDEGGEGQERVGAVTAVSSGSTIDWSLSKAQRKRQRRMASSGR